MTKRGFSLLHHSPFYTSICIFIIIIIIISSYVLSGERRRSLLSVPAPFCLESIRDAVMNIKTRTSPDVSVLLTQEPHMFSVVPRHFLPEVKNPCWYEEYHGDRSADPYALNQYGHYFKQTRAVFQRLRHTFTKHLRARDGKLYRFRCLPYFYIIGQPKCGTTDLFNRLKLHPDFRPVAQKEPHWWSRKRFGWISPAGGVVHTHTLQDYLDLFDCAVSDILNSSSHIITGEASASTMWDNSALLHHHDNSTVAQPPFLTQDFIHALQPNARVIVTLRDPVERLYSDYLYFGVSNKSSDDFHVKVSESLMMFDGCLQHNSLRSCVYNRTLNNAMSVRLHVGLYVVYILDWLSVFSRDQLLVLRLEDHTVNLTHSMHRIFSFLQLGPISEEREREIVSRPTSNSRRPSDRILGPMRPITRQLLHDFYSPFNQKLSEVLQNESFLWSRGSS